MSSLAETCLPLAYHLARRFKKRYPHLDHGDLIGQAFLGLAVAERRFKPHKARYVTYAHYWIRAMLVHYLRNQKGYEGSRGGGNRHRKLMRTAAMTNPVDPTNPFEAPGREQEPWEIAARREEKRLAARELNDWLRYLPEQEKRAMVLCKLDGLSYEEAAAVMQIAKSYVHSLMQSGRARLRRIRSIQEQRKVVR